MRILKISVIFWLLQLFSCKFCPMQKSKANFSLVKILSTYKNGILDKYDLYIIEVKYKDAKFIMINDSLIFLNNSNIKDTFKIGKQFILDSIVDTEQTKRYVGDEILCSNSGNRIVGVTFLNLLGIKENKLFYNDLICVNNSYKCVKMIHIDSENKALFFENDFFVLVFRM